MLVFSTGLISTWPLRPIQLTQKTLSPLLSQIIPSSSSIIFLSFLLPQWLFCRLDLQLFFLFQILIVILAGFVIVFEFFLFHEFLVGEVRLVEWLLIDLIGFAELLDRLLVTFPEMHVDNDCRIFAIILAPHTLFHLDLKHLFIQKSNLFHICQSTVLSTELIEISLDLDLSRWQFIFAIWLIHFGHYSCLLLNRRYGLVTPYAPRLCSNVLDEWIMTVMAFLLAVWSYVDRVHLLFTLGLL